MSAGPTTRRIGSVVRSCSRRASSWSPRIAADSGVSTKPAAIRFTRTGASSSARLAVNAGIAAVTADTIPSPRPTRLPPVPPMNSSVPPGLTLGGGVARNPECQQHVLADGEAGLLELDLPQGPVMRPGAGDHHVVDQGRQVSEESFQGSRIIGVEGGSAQRADLARGALEALAIPGGEDQLGPLSTRSSGGFEPDAGAAADHDDGLSEEFRLARDGRGSSCGAHHSSNQQSEITFASLSAVVLTILVRNG